MAMPVDAFLGVQQALGDNLTLELNGTASLGRRLDHDRTF